MYFGCVKASMTEKKCMGSIGEESWRGSIVAGVESPD